MAMLAFEAGDGGGVRYFRESPLPSCHVLLQWKRHGKGVVNESKIEDKFASFGQVLAVFRGVTRPRSAVVQFLELGAAEAALNFTEEVDAYKGPGIFIEKVKLSVTPVAPVLEKQVIREMDALEEVEGLAVSHRALALDEEVALLRCLRDVDAGSGLQLEQGRAGLGIKHEDSSTGPCGVGIDKIAQNAQSMSAIGDSETLSVLSRVFDKIPAASSTAECHTHDGVAVELSGELTVDRLTQAAGPQPQIDTHSAYEDVVGLLPVGGPVKVNFWRMPEKDRLFESIALSDADTDTSMKRVAEVQAPTEECHSFVCPAGSLLHVRGQARFAWRRNAEPAEPAASGEPLLLLTFRRRRRPGTTCGCAYPQYCDSKAAEKAAGVNPHTLAPTAIEVKHVHEFYDRAAEHFSHTRHTPWPKVSKFLEEVGIRRPPGSGPDLPAPIRPRRPLFLIDVGCGNGRFLKSMGPETLCLGLDRTKGLLEFAQDSGVPTAQCDAVTLPIRSCSADVVLCIAVLHHLSTEFHRRHAVRELVRVLRTGGEGLVYVWAVEQSGKSRHAFENHLQDVKVPWSLRKKGAQRSKKPSGGVEADAGGASESQDDGKLNAPGREEKLERFCHLFREGELENIVRSIDGAEVVDSYYDESNWAVRFRKTHGT